MIGLDTNVLVRYFARDDPGLTPVADALLDSLSSRQRGFVPTVVLAELVWTMDRRYGADHPEIIEIIGHLVQSEELVLESRRVVQSALRLYVASCGDFADCLILRTCEDAGCDNLATFDRAARRLAGLNLPH
ncbi:PIN domain-containing protein [Cupriavidus pauculus]|uniref:PIN domain-containing protein n=1 Tax=Cupriavidus pauculus TaxID=82633 RepID=UPI001EE39CAB|nr:type II toxin-antitoxin system VapC family toxin [Cupriavidus pauculus]GJG98771.1 type II toxin-antitoxin system VapC family toxin [Cupriavidus pauculus]